MKSLTNPSTSQTNVQIDSTEPDEPDEPERKTKRKLLKSWVASIPASLSWIDNYNAKHVQHIPQ